MKKSFLLISILLSLSLAGCTTTKVEDKDTETPITCTDGKDGIDGKDGTSMLTGQGAPGNDLGNIGDSYIDLDTWDFYIKATGGWIKQGNIKGADGQDGNDGNDGSDGSDGQNGQDGTRLMTGHGVPNNDKGHDGDSYIDLDTWNYYLKVINEWVYQGNFKGKDGTDGTDGSDYTKVPHTVIFDSRGGTSVPSQQVLHGEKIQRPNNPTKEGWVFDGWTYLGEKWSFIGYVVTENMTLFANWKLEGGTSDTIWDNADFVHRMEMMRENIKDAYKLFVIETPDATYNQQVQDTYNFAIESYEWFDAIFDDICANNDWNTQVPHAASSCLDGDYPIIEYIDTTERYAGNEVLRYLQDELGISESRIKSRAEEANDLAMIAATLNSFEKKMKYSLIEGNTQWFDYWNVIDKNYANIGAMHSYIIETDKTDLVLAEMNEKYLEYIEDYFRLSVLAWHYTPEVKEGWTGATPSVAKQMLDAAVSKSLSHFSSFLNLESSWTSIPEHEVDEETKTTIEQYIDESKQSVQ